MHGKRPTEPRSRRDSWRLWRRFGGGRWVDGKRRFLNRARLRRRLIEGARRRHVAVVEREFHDGWKLLEEHENAGTKNNAAAQDSELCPGVVRIRELER